MNASLKVKLINILPYFRDGVTLCDRIYALGKRLLEENLEKEVTIASFNLLTHVARKGIQVGEHINFIIATIDEYQTESTLVSSLFQNLVELATSSHWEKEQVEVGFSSFLGSRTCTILATHRFLPVMQTTTKSHSTLPLSQMFGCFCFRYTICERD